MKYLNCLPDTDKTRQQKLWQRNYYERIIRDESELNRVKEYIVNNPLRWHLDRENPDKIDIDKLEKEIFDTKHAKKGSSFPKAEPFACFRKHGIHDRENAR